MTTYVTLASADTEYGIVDADGAKRQAQQLADQHRKPVTLRDTTTDEVLGTVKPTTKAKGSRATRPTKAVKGKPVAKVAKPAKGNGKPASGKPKAKQPRGMVVEILKLASRKDGVSPAELNKLTKWKGAPWKWLFSNPKGNGYCDRWGYSFNVVPQESGGVRYYVEKR